MITTGLERLIKSDFAPLKGKSVAAIINTTSVDSRLKHILEYAAENRFRLAAVLAPEHGFSAAAQDMVAVNDRRERGVNFYSLYGETFESLSPTDQMLEGVDCVLYDVQDVGSRYYTFAATLILAMKKAAEKGLEVIALDRPNPINAIEIEGYTVEPGFESFVGLLPVPNRHGLTVCELAMLANDALKIGCNFQAITCEGLKRDIWYDQTGLSWVLPSPNMPTLDTAAVYPGICLLEGTNLSEGRGTTRPFEIFGAPYLNGYAFAKRLSELELKGVLFRPLEFIPAFQKHAGKVCGGVQLHITDRASFKPFITGVAVLKAALELGGDNFKWRAERYEFVENIPAIDLLAGSDYLRKKLEEGASLKDIAQHYANFELEFAELKKNYHLY